MNSYIKGIAIFKDSTTEGRRILELSRGLNIIAGHSKTGKSAILDIIDWCLGAKDSTIPQGVITKFANLYAILIDFKGTTLLLARENGVKGYKYLHVKQISKNLLIDDIHLKDIDSNQFLKINEALEKINEVVNLTLGEKKLLEVDFKIPNVTLRSALTFNFQHQDIISSNSRLFYIAPIKNHFPILAGWFNSEYYIVLESINKYQKAIKRLSNDNKKAKDKNSKLEYNVKQALRIYYNLIGIEFNENWTIDQCIKRIENIEEFKKQEFSNNLQNRQDELDLKIEKKQAETLQINRQLSKIETQQNHGNNYELFLDKYTERAKLYPIQSDYVCPICKKPNEKLSFEALDIIEADNWLQKELNNLPTEKLKFDKENDDLKMRKNGIQKVISKLKKEYIQNKNILDKIVKEKNMNEQKQKAQWKAKSEAEIFIERHIPLNEKTLDENKAKLAIYQEKKRTYNESERYAEAKYIIEQRMSTIVTKLDFEHKPPELFFELNPQKNDSYKLFHNNTGEERVFLRQIGSASNALACHIGLFLSFMYYFSHQENSKVPSILFFDQPSQVYFPSGEDNTDIEKVGQIYETILDELVKIESETGINPQIIVADHIKDLGEKTVQLYGHYFKADWRDGKGLI